jgi:predicted nucleic acid-binding protein
MRLLFDSSILIAHLRGESRATALLQSVTNDERLTSVLARVEIEGGMRSDERIAVASLFGVMRLLPVSDAIARRAAEHLRRFRRSHPGIDVVDYVVAATAELHEAGVATLNVKHFPMMRGLRPPW